MNRSTLFLGLTILLCGCNPTSFSSTPANNSSVAGAQPGGSQPGLQSQYQLAWTPTCTDQNGFTVEESTDNVNYQLIAQVAANQTSISLSNVTSGQTYYFRVAAFNSAGTSTWSQILTSTIP